MNKIDIGKIKDLSSKEHLSYDDKKVLEDCLLRSIKETQSVERLRQLLIENGKAAAASGSPAEIRSQVAKLAVEKRQLISALLNETIEELDWSRLGQAKEI